MTQEDLSKKSDLYVSTIKKYETGERKPKTDQLQKIADALGVSVTVFLDFNINTISDVLSLIIKLDEQAPLKIQSATDSNGNYYQRAYKSLSMIRILTKPFVHT